MWRGLIAAIALFIPTWTWASTSSYLNGNQLNTFCNREEPTICAGYILGVVDAHDTVVQMKLMSGPLFCMPPEVTGGQMQAIVKKHLKEYPEDLHLYAGSIVMAALLNAFPCTN